MQAGLCNAESMAARNKGTTWILAAGFAITAAGVALRSHPATFVGLLVAALAIRYRRNPPVWQYLCFVGLLIAMLAWDVLDDSAHSPLIGALPLILSYVFDYYDERAIKRSMADLGHRPPAP
jgi:ABC-type enterochelin transport system permease subunit